MTKNTDTTTEVIDLDEVEETEEVVTPKMIAARLGLDPKAFRRWLRRHTGDRAGKGGRWGFSPDEADELIEAFHSKNKAEEADDEVEAEDLDFEAILDED